MRIKHASSGVWQCKLEPDRDGVLVVAGKRRGTMLPQTGLIDPRGEDYSDLAAAFEQSEDRDLMGRPPGRSPLRTPLK